MNPSDSSLSIEHQIVASIRQVMRAVDLHSKRLVENFGFTGPQIATLQEAIRLGPTTPSAIARGVHLSQGTVTGILSRLEKKGCITQRRSATDRRAVIIEVTADGRRLMDLAPSLLQDTFRLELQRLEDWERMMILATLKRVAGLMGAEQLDASPHLITDAADLTDDGDSRGATPA